MCFFVVLLAIVLLFPITSNCNSLNKQLIKEDLFDVCFISEDLGWTCGRWGTILKTNDGGKNWVLQNTGTDLTLSSIFFISAQRGWAVGEKGIILYTNNGGEKWFRQQSPIDKYLMSVCFTANEIGWIAGEATNILYTKDGGRTWKVQFSDTEYMLKKIAFYDAMTGWAVGEYGFIYHTSDGGRNWIHQDGHFTFNSDTFKIESGSTLFDIVPISRKKAIAVGIAGIIKETNDGGKVWESVNIGLQSNKPYFAITAGDNGRNVLIAGKHIVAASNDGGKTFENAITIPSIDCYGWIYKIAVRGKAGYVGVGKEGSIYLSDVKGIEWRRTDNIDDANTGLR